MMIELKARRRPHPLRAKLAAAKLGTGKATGKAARVAATERARLALPFQPHRAAPMVSAARRWSNRLTRAVLIVASGLLLLNLVRCAAPFVGVTS